MVRRPDADLEFPDLELDASAVRPRAARIDPGSFDDDFDISAPVELELGGPAPSAAAEAIAPHPVVETRSGWPTGAPPDRDAFQFEASELTALGGFGPAPGGIHLAPLYAWRVLAAQRALRAKLIALDGELHRAEESRDRELGELVAELHATLENDSRFSSSIAAISELTRKADAEGQALAAAEAEREKQLAEIEARRANVERELELRREQERAATATLTDREHDLARSEARLKRVQIEMRSIEELALKSAAPGTPMPPELAARYAEQQERLAEIEPELAARRETALAARAAFELARSELERSNRELAAVTAARRGLDERHRPALAARGQSAAHASEQRRTALADVGRAVLAQRGAVAVSEARITRIAAADASVERLARDAERHLRALDAYDRAGFELGRNVVIGAAIALVLALIVAIAL